MLNCCWLYTYCERLGVNTCVFVSPIIDRSIRLRPQRTCEQERVSLSNAILHNSAAHTKHTRMRIWFYFVRLLVAQWVVIGQYAMGRSLMDWSIAGFLRPGSYGEPTKLSKTLLAVSLLSISLFRRAIRRLLVHILKLYTTNIYY